MRYHGAFPFLHYTLRASTSSTLLGALQYQGLTYLVAVFHTSEGVFERVSIHVDVAFYQGVHFRLKLMTNDCKRQEPVSSSRYIFYSINFEQFPYL